MDAIRPFHVRELQLLYDCLFLPKNSEAPLIDKEALEISPGLTKYWIPECDESFKPKLDMVFKTLEDGIEFYKQYAACCGFDSRIGSQTKDRRPRTDTIVWKYVVCNRAGFKNIAKVNPPETSHVMPFSVVSDEHTECSNDDAEAHVFPEHPESSHAIPDTEKKNRGVTVYQTVLAVKHIRLLRYLKSATIILCRLLMPDRFLK
ncbi:unnamed protein product [Cuscuta europaea]|uniref:FAR1 domain-containing protein n=1 Tax=Cuscuta europaea TaxID=41803 RepID=A0A9P1EEW1_CUSEU|nr:unnamed protein product [Cuscuta europaea]